MKRTLELQGVCGEVFFLRHEREQSGRHLEGSRVNVTLSQTMWREGSSIRREENLEHRPRCQKEQKRAGVAKMTGLYREEQSSHCLGWRIQGRGPVIETDWKMLGEPACISFGMLICASVSPSSVIWNLTSQPFWSLWRCQGPRKAGIPIKWKQCRLFPPLLSAQVLQVHLGLGKCRPLWSSLCAWTT